MKTVLVFLLVMTCSVTTLWAQVGERTFKKKYGQNRVALVIGNSAYQHTTQLKNPVNDAVDMTTSLKKRGFQVTLLKDATQRQMKKAITQFGKSLQKISKNDRKGGVGLFFYAGHGIQYDGVNYLIPVDAEIEEGDELEFDAVDANRVLAKMESANNDFNIVILDACRDNPFRGWSRGVKQGLSEMKTPRGSFLAYATAPGDVAADGTGDNGVFTKHFLKQMEVPGLEISQMFKKVIRGVRIDTGNKQVPWQNASMEGDFYFTPQQTTPQPVVSSLDTSSTPIIPPAPSSPAVSVEDIKEQVEKEAANRKAWSENLENMKSIYGEIEQIEKQNVSPHLKIVAWRRLINGFSQNNPYSTEDEPLLQRAQTRIAYWQGEAKRIKQVQQEAERKRIAEAKRKEAEHKRKEQAAIQTGGDSHDSSVPRGFVLIQPDTFQMGINDSSWAKPVHQVHINRSFYISDHEVTVGEYRQFVKATGHRAPKGCYGSYHNWDKSNRGDHPINCVSWNDAQTYIKWLNQQSSGAVYRLCTEAEWEYVARAGTTTKWSCGNDESCLQDYAWYSGNNTSDGTKAVKTKKPNAWAVYDMHGNVWEWVQDEYCSYDKPLNEDNERLCSGSERVYRGGGFFNSAGYARLADRRGIVPSFRNYDLGFRLCSSL